MSPDPVIHVVDDDDAVRDALGVLLTVEGWTVRRYASAQAFLDDPPARDGPGCIVTDVHMRGIGGVELLRRLREVGVSLPVIVITGRASAALTAEALAAGAAAILEKPFGHQEILQAVRRVLPKP
jgi:two-component system response regulator FixJ